MPVPRFEYMEFAKIDHGNRVRFPLAGSGFNLGDPDLLKVDPDRIRLYRDTAYGDPGIRARIATRYGVPETHALPAAGTSLGIFLLAASQLGAGDRVLVEAPSYEALLSAPRMLGAAIDRFDRPFEEGYALDPDRVAAALTPATKMVVVTNLHNPSGVRLSADVEAALLTLAERRGFLLFVDEVYRDFLEGPVGTIYRPGAPVVVASSLTKVYGMGGLRAGWLLGSPEVLARAARVVDLLHVIDPTPMTAYIEAAFDAADRLRERNLAISREGRTLLAAWMTAHPDVGWVPPDGGLCSFPRLPAGLTGTEVHRRLLEEEATLVVPGRFFEDDRHIRVGVGAGPEALAGGLAALERVIGREK